MNGAVIITMAGLGSRFRKEGYDQPKFRIKAHSRSLFDWSLHSLDHFRKDGWDFHFVVRREDAAGPWVQKRCASLAIADPDIMEINELTDGQATTALLAGQNISRQDQPIIIYNIDTLVDPRSLLPERVRGEGWVPCADLPGDAWSFARTDSGNRAVELREKQRISNHATIGLYYFSSFTLYAELYCELYEAGGVLEAGERYIAPLYNPMIARGLPVYVEDITREDFYALGTPSDVRAFSALTAPNFGATE